VYGHLNDKPTERATNFGQMCIASQISVLYLSREQISYDFITPRVLIRSSDLRDR